jgi:hypothetical protein
MWIFSKYGFFSVTQHAKRRDNIQVRARTDQDLLDLKAAFPALDRCPIIETPDADYRWRLIVQRWKWEVVGSALVADIDYGNFKGKIATIPTQRNKCPMLHEIWHHHHQYQERKHRPDPFAGHPELFRPHGDHLFDEDEYSHMKPEEDEHDPRWEDSRDSADDPEYQEPPHHKVDQQYLDQVNGTEPDNPEDVPAFLSKRGNGRRAGKRSKGKGAA